MYFTVKLNNPVEGIDKVLEAASRFDKDIFLYALQYKNWDEGRIESMVNDISTARTRMENEYDRLVNFAKVFNKEFATMDNKCFDSALKVLNKLRSGIKETKEIFLQFCPRAHKESIYHRIGNKPVSAFEYSYISATTYDLSLFEFEGFPPCISNLYNEMTKFFLLLVRCIQLCKQVLADEKKIKLDCKYCKFLFEQLKSKILLEIADIVMMIPRDSDYLSEAKNSAIASRNLYDNDEAWAAASFHVYSRTEVKHLVIKQVLESEKNSDITRKERSLFGDDENKVHKYRYIIQHFDELIPDSHNNKKLPAKYIQMFFQYVGIPSGFESEAVEYFNKTYLSAPDHKHMTVSYQAVNSYKKSVILDKDGSFKEFSAQLKMRYFSILPVNNTVNY